MRVSATEDSERVALRALPRVLNPATRNGRRQAIDGARAIGDDPPTRTRCEFRDDVDRSGRSDHQPLRNVGAVFVAQFVRVRGPADRARIRSADCDRCARTEHPAVLGHSPAIPSAPAKPCVACSRTGASSFAPNQAATTWPRPRSSPLSRLPRKRQRPQPELAGHRVVQRLVARGRFEPPTFDSHCPTYCREHWLSNATARDALERAADAPRREPPPRADP